MSRNKIVIKRNHEEIENMNRHIISQKIKSIINNIQLVKPRPDHFTSEFF